MIETELLEDSEKQSGNKMGQAEVYEALSRKEDMPVKKIELYPPTAAAEALEQAQAADAARRKVEEAAGKPRTYDDPGYANMMKNAAVAGPSENDRMATGGEVRAAGVTGGVPEAGGVTKMTPVAGPGYDLEAGAKHAGGSKSMWGRAKSGLSRMFGRSQPKHKL